ncbi:MULTISPECIES: hypothetical protein [unclassified Mesorhizobium]
MQTASPKMRAAPKCSPNASCDEEKPAFDRHGKIRAARKKVSARVLMKHMAAMQLLLCTMNINRLYWLWEDQRRVLIMKFLTEMFTSRRHRENSRYRAAFQMLDAMSNADRADIGVKPADFPRIAREMALK